MRLDLRSFRQLLDDIVVVARRHARQVLPPVVLPIMICGVLLIVVQQRWMREFTAAGPDDMGEFIAGFVGMMALAFATLFVYAILFGALTVFGMDAVAEDGRVPSLGRGLRFVLRPAVFGTMVLVGIATSLAMMMCFVPILYVGPILTFVLPVMVAEDRVGIDAIRRSVDLAHFNPTGSAADSVLLQLLCFSGVAMMINYIASFVVQMPLTAATLFLTMRESMSGEVPDPARMMSSMMWLQIPSVVLSSLVTVLIWLYWVFGICLMYREVRRRREATDLVAAVGEITGASPEDAAATAGGEAVGGAATDEPASP